MWPLTLLWTLASCVACCHVILSRPYMAKLVLTLPSKQKQHRAESGGNSGFSITASMDVSSHLCGVKRLKTKRCGNREPCWEHCGRQPSSRYFLMLASEEEMFQTVRWQLFVNVAERFDLTLALLQLGTDQPRVIYPVWPRCSAVTSSGPVVSGLEAVATLTQCLQRSSVCVRDLLGENEYKMILVMFSLVCNFVYCTNCCFSLAENGPFIFKYFLFTSGSGPLCGGRHVLTVV